MMAASAPKPADLLAGLGHLPVVVDIGESEKLGGICDVPLGPAAGTVRLSRPERHPFSPGTCGSRGIATPVGGG